MRHETVLSLLFLGQVLGDSNALQVMASLNPRVTLADVPANVQGPAQVLAAGNVPTDQAVARNSMFAYRLKTYKDCRAPGTPSVTDQELAAAVKNEHRITQAAVDRDDAVLNQLQNLGNQLQNVSNQLQSLSATVNAKLDNQAAMRGNYFARDFSHPLRPIAVMSPGGPQAVGTVPALLTAGGVSPGSVQELIELTPAQIVTLQTYYNHNFGIAVGDNTEMQRHKFGLYIGW
ncbi:hypothetical protein KFL_013130020 [Klebsormidium nitens]|uniref:Uncharacterized protein n=1 Tax=Klebsormidium nitens TaxID=105231 RepID=A0A1Y1IQY9_KLENI|nr:hypothetical protein KFL_013130020 [Klebsormidium nitens]|eukprot:GAQ93124.1 hypothetical protein KFL_013130020 [Klebsormidium nitens]